MRRRRNTLRHRYGHRSDGSSKWHILLDGKIVDTIHYAAGRRVSAEDVLHDAERSNAWYLHEGGYLEVRRAS
jgi:hypothetical protein